VGRTNIRPESIDNNKPDAESAEGLEARWTGWTRWTGIDTDKSEDTGMGLHVGSAGSFHGFRVTRRDVKSCLEKLFGGLRCRSAHPTRLFMVSGCPKRDMNNCSGERAGEFTIIDHRVTLELALMTL
jgi:hypothetical protein